MRRILSREFVDRVAKENNFQRDNTEKVMRLCDILEFLNTDKFCKDKFALKGGTAINLLFTDMPRLSVDIDLDFAENLTKEETQSFRDNFREVFMKYLTNANYRLAERQRSSYVLESYRISYIATNGNQDKIEVEINYGDRSHILSLPKITSNTKLSANEFEILTLDKIELYASKINALLSRATPRDLYDVNCMLENKIIKTADYELLRKCLVFYNMVGGEQDIDDLDLENIENIADRDFRNLLKPVLKNNDKFNLETAQENVIKFIRNIVALTDKEKEFILHFKKQEYKPELLFSSNEILGRIQNHPMALWRCKKENK
ncbi:MAG: nucleotidyl transferase AbiEii/AbiGii toxin family protein [Christensenellaceae bacterium]|jgi:predicted nucleotidyltransferase component of viral defense system|nr:nucleotidyl transferase AbiEii/AbiGii toxin family protein [Christensenellaceae bacterium]